MLFWLITVGELLPVDDQNVRLFRTGLLAKSLAGHGHSVVWWTSTFDHFNKRHYRDKDTEITWLEHEGVKIRMLYGAGYRSNVSLRRVADHARIAWKFMRAAKNMPRPDVVVCSLPTLELSVAATRYGRLMGVPVVLDVRDLWPDIFLDQAPFGTRWAVRIILLPLFVVTRRAFQGATAITGVTPEFVEWGLRYARRKRSPLDRDFPMGYSDKRPTDEAIVKAREFWSRFLKEDDFIVCFFGALSRQFDLDTVILAAKSLWQRNIKIRVVLCGSGDRLAYYRQQAEECENIVLPGWVGAAEIWTLMRMASVGLAPYLNIRNFTDNLPNKPLEYMSAGLPIVSCLRGVLERLLSEADCGVMYEEENPDDLAARLIELYECPERRNRMAQNSFQLFQDKFVADNVYTDMMHYLEELGGRLPTKDT